MKAVDMFTHLHYHVIPILLIVLLVPASGASGRECTLPAAPDRAPATIPQSELFSFYYHQPPVRQSPLDILNRLESEARIRDKLTLYSLAVDGKNFSNLDRIYTKDAVVEVSSDYPLLRGLETIKEASEKSVENVDTRLLLGTQIIKMYEDDPCAASSFTYFASTYLGKDMLVGKIGVRLGEFRDSWYRNEAGEWFILYRSIVFAGPIIGDDLL